jgi:hypothetical protein
MITDQHLYVYSTGWILSKKFICLWYYTCTFLIIFNQYHSHDLNTLYHYSVLISNFHVDSNITRKLVHIMQIWANAESATGHAGFSLHTEEWCTVYKYTSEPVRAQPELRGQLRRQVKRGNHKDGGCPRRRHEIRVVARRRDLCLRGTSKACSLVRWPMKSGVVYHVIVCWCEM